MDSENQSSLFKRLLLIIISSVSGGIVFLIIIIVVLSSLLIVSVTDDDKNSESDETFGKVIYNAKFTVTGWAFPVLGCSYASINNKSFPSYSGHTGVDINIGVVGKPVLAVDNGRVIISTAKRNSQGNYVSYGEYIVLQHQTDEGSNILTYYCHMSPNSRMVNAGDMVEKGQQIGVVGTTGNSSGPHLHFEVRQGGLVINPLPYLQSIVDSDELNTDTDIRDEGSD